MRKTLTSLMAGAALAMIAGAAGAQPYGGYYPPYPGGPYGNSYGQTATLYELPGFQGRSVVVNGSTGNLADIDFNDRTRSVRLNGTWKLCEDAGFRSRCETMTGSIPDLRQRGISGLSSLQPTNDYPGGGYPGGYGGGAVQGRSVVFYPGPVGGGGYGYDQPYGYGGGNAYGYGVGRRGADNFCRSMGNREAVYYDSNGGVLQDVLCRR
jgi:hypothetical protein